MYLLTIFPFLKGINEFVRGYIDGKESRKSSMCNIC